MKSIQRKVDRFLKLYQMHPMDVDVETTVQAFRAEFKRGLAGQKGSLDMIPTYIEAGVVPPSGRPVVVADAGGTNFRVATVHFDDNKKPIVEDLRLYKMPGIDQEVGKDEFFKIVANYLKDFAKGSDRIGFCFSYPIQSQPDKDARAIRFCKEVKAAEVVGQPIGANLNRAFANAGIGGNRRIILLNDTVATLLAGCGHNNKIFSGYIGFILGTGTNCSYLEKNSNIKKEKSLDPDKWQIINIESGSFGKCPRGKIDVALDKTTVNPGVYKFEKMLSGAYLGLLYYKVLERAAADGLFSDEAGELICGLSGFDTKKMNVFMQHPYGDSPLAKACRAGSDADVLTAYCLADRLTERAAKLSAINLSSAAIQSEQGKDPTRPICIVAEGTTYYQMKTIKSRTEFYLKSYLENKCGIYTEMVHVENATLIGAAIAGLTN